MTLLRQIWAGFLMNLKMLGTSTTPTRTSPGANRDRAVTRSGEPLSTAW
jgi:hypothetical protein